MAIVNHHFGRDGAGVPVLTGKVHNLDPDHEVINIGVALAFFGGDGTVLSVDEVSYLDSSSSLAAAAEDTFTITPYAVPSDAASYHIFLSGSGGFG